MLWGLGAPWGLGSFWGIVSKADVKTHANDAIDRLRCRYRGKPKLEALIRCLANEVQKSENVIGALKCMLMLELAQDDWLDLLGDLVGLDRVSTVDDIYREFIRLQILCNASNGTIPDVVAIGLALQSGDATGISYVHSPPAAGCVVLPNLPASTPVELLARVAAKVAANGTGFCIIATSAADLPIFTETGDAVDGAGFSETGDTTADHPGTFAEVY